MRKSNWLYVLYRTFCSDLLFWIVIDNLFLSTVKGLNAFDIVLVTLAGLSFSLLLYPLTNQIVKKTNNKFSIIMGALCYIVATICFMISNNLVGFIIGQTFHGLATPFRMVSNVILTNNLKHTNKENEFIKWESYGALGYSIITLSVSIFAGILFNINPYLPVILTLIATFIALLFAFIYEDSNKNSNMIKSQTVSIKKNKVMILLLVLNIFAIGTYIFLQTKSTLLIQYILVDANINLAKISIIISVIVFGSRICRVVSNILFPSIYNKTKNKPQILILLSILLLISNSLLALGATINANYILKIIFIIIGLYLILLIRDIYELTETKIIVLNIEADKQKHAFLLLGFYEKLGKLIANGFGLIILGFFSLNIVYMLMISFSIIQVILCVPLSKYLKAN